MIQETIDISRLANPAIFPSRRAGLEALDRPVGPGFIVLAGTSIGSGEWLFGPAVTAQYGAALLWLPAAPSASSFEDSATSR